MWGLRTVAVHPTLSTLDLFECAKPPNDSVFVHLPDHEGELRHDRSQGARPRRREHQREQEQQVRHHNRNRGFENKSNQVTLCSI